MAGAHSDASKFHVPGVCAIARDVALECVHRTNPELISFYAERNHSEEWGPELKYPNFENFRHLLHFLLAAPCLSCHMRTPQFLGKGRRLEIEIEDRVWNPSEDPV
uniref:DUF3365 domain-containing protein n=1 Tax=Ascaris lumbricoides TaxID=6252 RepID=A0A0M3I0X4_ASCLU